jgi:hypothetical protein
MSFIHSIVARAVIATSSVFFFVASASVAPARAADVKLETESYTIPSGRPLARRGRTTAAAGARFPRGRITRRFVRRINNSARIGNDTPFRAKRMTAAGDVRVR